MELRLLLCCETSVVDARSNNLSVVNIVEELSSPSFPVVVPKLSVIILLARQEDEPQLVSARLRLALADQTLFERGLELSFQYRTRVRQLVDMHGLVLPSPGTLRVSLFVGDQEMGRWLIEIKSIGQPQVDLFTAGEGGPPLPQGREPVD